MIQINLLPGGRKKTKSRGAPDLLASLAAVVAQVKDPFLIAAVASVALAGGAVGTLFLAQTREAAQLAERERVAVQDSTRYAAVLGEKAKAQAQVDSVMRQLAVIREIDNNRYVWPHVMDEVSRALPPYTWLNSIEQISAPPAAAAAAPAPGAAPAAGDSAAPPKPAKKALLDDDVEALALKFLVTGTTVDIQALTRFMRVLEASPFVQNVNLSKSSLVVAEGREVTEFRLEAEYQNPDKAAIQTVPVTLSVR
jgi:Tfp pilus assembly protein PilN